MNYPLIFDGHNDVLGKMLKDGGLSATDAFISGNDGHIDLPKAQNGGLGGGFFAIWVSSQMDLADALKAMVQPHYDLPLPDAIPLDHATKDALAQAALLIRLEELGALMICRNAADIRTCLNTGKLAAIMHMEGAEAIDADLLALDVFHSAGLRSIGPVWSRPTIFGNGVPFRYPSSPDTGEGLTQAGHRLVDRCNELRIMIDLAHLNEKGFWDVAARSHHPLVATHSNAHAICPHPRNLTDRQLAAIAESDGMVGLNFAAAFLRPDGMMNADVPVEYMLRHIDHLIEHLGEDRVGLGSDFDGAVVPQVIGDAAGLPVLCEAMRGHGYDAALLAKLCHGNWLRVLEKTFGG